MGGFHDQSLVDVWDDTTAGNCGFDESIELLVTSDGKLQMSWGDSLNLKVLRGVTGKLENLSGQVLEDGCAVNSGSGSNSAVGTDSTLKESVDSTNWELYDSNYVK